MWFPKGEPNGPEPLPLVRRLHPLNTESNQMHRLLGKPGILSATIFSELLSRSFPIVMFVAIGRGRGK